MVSRKLKMKKTTKTAPNGKYKTGKLKKPLNKNNITDYYNLCSNFELHTEEFRKSWKYTLEEHLVFYKMDISSRPIITVSVKIDKDMNVDVYTEHGKIAKKDMECILDSQTVLKKWSQLKNLLRYFDAENYAGFASIQYNLNQSMKFLKSCETINSAKGDAFHLEPKLKFLQNQIHALLRNRYTHYMFLLAYSIYLKSSTCYKYIQSLDFLMLPDEKVLVEYISESMKNTKENK